MADDIGSYGNVGQQIRSFLLTENPKLILRTSETIIILRRLKNNRTSTLTSPLLVYSTPNLLGHSKTTRATYVKQKTTGLVLVPFVAELDRKFQTKCND